MTGPDGLVTVSSAVEHRDTGKTPGGTYLFHFTDSLN
jgi:hypothetical protein